MVGLLATVRGGKIGELQGGLFGERQGVQLEVFGEPQGQFLVTLKWKVQLEVFGIPNIHHVPMPMQTITNGRTIFARLIFHVLFHIYV